MEKGGAVVVSTRAYQQRVEFVLDRLAKKASLADHPVERSEV
jgi:hypothetical protein